MPTVYEIVTQTIIEKLEAGEVPWRRPWITSAPKNLVSGKEYRGINTFCCGASWFPASVLVDVTLRPRSSAATCHAGERSNRRLFERRRRE